MPFPDSEFEKIHGYIHNYNKRDTKNLTIKKEDQFENGLVYKLERSGDGKIFYVVSKIKLKHELIRNLKVKFLIIKGLLEKPTEENKCKRKNEEKKFCSCENKCNECYVINSKDYHFVAIAENNRSNACKNDPHFINYNFEEIIQTGKLDYIFQM